MRKNNIDFIDFDDSLDLSLKEEIYKALDVIKELESINLPIEVTVSFVNDETIKKLNKKYRNINTVTDVLSFPVFEDKEAVKSFNHDSPVLLGDVFLNVNQAQKQAQEIDNTLEEELLYLTIHSFLHLIGYDHMNEIDKKEMRTIEKKIFELTGKS